MMSRDPVARIGRLAGRAGWDRKPVPPLSPDTELTAAAPFLASGSRTATAHLVSITQRGGDLRLWSAPSGERVRAFLRRFTIIEHPDSNLLIRLSARAVTRCLRTRQPAGVR